MDPPLDIVGLRKYPVEMAMANDIHPQNAPPVWMGSSTGIGSMSSIGTGIGEMLLFNALTCYRSLFSW